MNDSIKINEKENSKKNISYERNISIVTIKGNVKSQFAFYFFTLASAIFLKNLFIYLQLMTVKTC